MTATLQLDRTARAVHSQHGRHKAYLEIVPERAGLRIQPTELGKRALNRFWMVWLRKLLLEQTDLRRSYAIEIRSRSVFVNSTASYEAMLGTVQTVASEVYPVNEPPLNRQHSMGGRQRLVWEIKYGDRFIPWALLAANLTLPNGAWLDCTQWQQTAWHGSLRLYRHPGDPLPLSQLGMLVELEVALACHR